MKKIEGVLEIDASRGVVYFTQTPMAGNVTEPWFRMRICSLPSIPDNVDFIDITVSEGGSSYTTNPTLIHPGI